MFLELLKFTSFACKAFVAHSAASPKSSYAWVIPLRQPSDQSGEISSITFIFIFRFSAIVINRSCGVGWSLGSFSNQRSSKKMLFGFGFFFQGLVFFFIMRKSIFRLFGPTCLELFLQKLLKPSIKIHFWNFWKTDHDPLESNDTIRFDVDVFMTLWSKTFNKPLRR